MHLGRSCLMFEVSGKFLLVKNKYNFFLESQFLGAKARMEAHYRTLTAMDDLPGYASL